MCTLRQATLSDRPRTQERGKARGLALSTHAQGVLEGVAAGETTGTAQVLQEKALLTAHHGAVRRASGVLRTTSICDRSALTTRVEPPRADCASGLWFQFCGHIVRASVRGTVRDTAGDQRERSEGCCLIRAVGMHLRGACLHGTALGSHQLARFPKSTILSGEAESCPDAGRFRVDAK